VRGTGPSEPIRLSGSTRPEQARGPLHAVGARCCAPGGAWHAPVPQPVSDDRSGAPHKQLAGHGTADRSAAPRRTGKHGWRLVGRGLITGGFLLCGWLASGAGHAYASQITAPAAPHENLTGVLTGLATVGNDASEAGLLPAAQHSGTQHPGTRHPAAKRPASTLHVVPRVSGMTGAGAGDHDPAVPGSGSSAPAGSVPARSGPARSAPGSAVLPLAGHLTTEAATVQPLAAAVSQASGTVLSGISGQARSLAFRLGTDVTGGQFAGIAGTIASVTSPVLQHPQGSTGGRRAGHAACSLAANPVGILPLAQAPTGTHHPDIPAVRAAWADAGPLAGFLVPGSLLAGQNMARVARHPCAQFVQDKDRQRSHPADRLGTGTATQTDPVPSAGGTGAAQAVAQAPPSAGGRNLAGRLVRIVVSRWPVGHPAVTDPAVSPD
jgi:hypothetical protein